MEKLIRQLSSLLRLTSGKKTQFSQPLTGRKLFVAKAQGEH
jgi:hypothetical protein